MYPYAPLASHVIGYMGAITAEDEQHYEDLGYDTSLGGEDVGRAGVELSYEEALHGKWGEVTYEVDAANRIVREISSEAPVNGMDVQLSIDLDLQQYTERLLQTQLRADAPVQRRRTRRSPSPTASRRARSTRDLAVGTCVNYKAPAGSTIVLNNQTGQIMAMASYPTFDNRWFSADVDSDEVRRDLPDQGPRRRQARPRPRRARQPGDPGPVQHGLDVQGVHRLRRAGDRPARPPARRTTTRARTSCSRSTQRRRVCAGGRALRVPQLVVPASSTGRAGTATINVMQSLAVSSDAFFYKLGEEFYLTPGTQLQDQVQLFGFGADTGIDLPFEFDGRVPTNELKQQLIESGALGEDEADDDAAG